MTAARRRFTADRRGPRRAARLIGMIVACAVLLAASVDAAGVTPPDAATAAEPAPSLTPWTTGEATAAALRTPRAALEAFLRAGEAERYWEAAGVLNLSDLPVSERRDRGLELARMLHFVIDRRLDIDWRDLPDRPDGARDVAIGFAADGASTAAPAPRHNLLVGQISGVRAPVEIRLERVQPPDMPPVWLIARSTVRSIDMLYDRHGPAWLERTVPAWVLARLGTNDAWQWIGFVGLVVLSIAVGNGVQRLVARWMATSPRRRIRGLASEVARPLTFLVTVSVLWIATTTLLTLTGPLSRWVGTALAALQVIAITWLGMSAINYLSEYVGRQQVDRLALSDEVGARRQLTYLSVARRVFIFLVLILGLGVVLAQFAVFRTLGTSLLASAGVAGIVLGIAAQGSLANIMAGIQIALTQLVRIGDAVYFEEQWGTIEDITYTFVVIRTWDQRRIAVPNRHIIAHPIENWEMNNANMILPVILHVDYRTPVDELRRRYAEILEAAPDWDRLQEPNLQVIDAKEDVLVIRALCSAENAATAWNLHCRVREELVAFVREWDGGRYLPRSRVTVEGEAPAPLKPVDLLRDRTTG
jgi:small-conductance mechanosensitive channel